MNALRFFEARYTRIIHESMFDPTKAAHEQVRRNNGYTALDLLALRSVVRAEMAWCKARRVQSRITLHRFYALQQAAEMITLALACGEDVNHAHTFGRLSALAFRLALL